MTPSFTVKGVLAAAGGVAMLAAALPAAAQSDFYKGKEIRVLIGYSAGGGYDAYARLVSRHMANFIPGHPGIVPQNMPGAGSAVAAQYLTHKAPHDGTVMATLGQNLPLSQALYPGNAKFDTRAMIWIGNANEGNNVVTIWHTAGIHDWKDLTEKQVIVGATNVRSTSVMYPRAMNNILGTRFKIITGFRGGSRINLATERGEVQGRGSNAWASVKAKTPDWLKKNLITIPVQMGLSKEKDLPDVPLVMNLAPNEAGKQVLRLISSGVRIGRPLVATPGVPPDRVRTLRAAFDATMKDPKFLSEAHRMKLDINPVSGVEVQKVVDEVVSAPADIVALTKAALTKGETFDCKSLVKDKKLCKSKKKKKHKK